MKRLVFCVVFLFGLGVFRTVLYSADTVVISFEEKEGFPVPTNESSFNDLSTNGGIVTAWTVENVAGATYIWGTEDGPGGVKYPDAPAPISGTQIGGLITAGGHGIGIGTMHLNKESNYTLTSFHWAYRGNGDSRPGGNAYLELEYFDINDKSLGKEKFQGGLNPDWSPKFDLARIGAQYQSVALSKVIFKSVCPEGQTHATFFIEDMTLSIAGKSVSSPVEVSKFKQVDTTPPMLSLPNPPPDSTVSGNPIISVNFTDVGSGIDSSSAKILVDGKYVTDQAKVTEKGLTLEKPLEKGIHQVEVRVSDKAGNMGNRQRWRFGVNVSVPVEAHFEKGLFIVNSEPYFPIGIYNGSCDPGNPTIGKPYLSQAAQAGLNFQLLGESTSLEDLDIMLKYDMKALKAVNAALGRISEQNKGAMISMVNGTKDHPGMLGWWVCDPETVEATRKNMALGYKTLKEEDPNHPVVWVLSHSDKYKENVTSNDACVVYFYPILNPDGNYTVVSIYDVSLKPAFEAAAPSGKQIWFGVQGIDYRINAGKPLASPNDFRPTAQELRAMSYLALAKGVKGLWFWAGGGSPVPEVYNDLAQYPAQWQELMKIASEVRFLSPVLAMGKPTKTVRQEPENTAIHYLELEHEGKKTLLAVNVADYPVTVTWHFPDIVQPMVLFENRVLSKASQEITDTFKPLEVHIYRWE